MTNTTSFKLNDITDYKVLFPGKKLKILKGCEDKGVTALPPVHLSCAEDGGVIDIVYAKRGRTQPYSQVMYS